MKFSIKIKGGESDVNANCIMDFIKNYPVPCTACPVYLHRSNDIYIGQRNTQQSFLYRIGNFIHRLSRNNVVGDFRKPQYVPDGEDSDTVLGSLCFLYNQPDVRRAEIFKAGIRTHRRFQQFFENLIIKYIKMKCEGKQAMIEFYVEIVIYSGDGGWQSERGN